MEPTVFETDFQDLRLVKKGKVRDLYDLGDALLMVATDRISAFDVIMPDPIPDKGKILTQISLFWFKTLASIVGNHLISADVADFPSSCRPYEKMLKGRSLLVKKADPLPIECVVRGYLSGSGWKAYRETGAVCGIRLGKRSQRIGPPPRAHLHPVHQGGDRAARPQYRFRGSRPAHRESRGPQSPGANPRPLPERGVIGGGKGDSHRGHQVRIRLRR